jgi:hypothetical protein
MIAIVVLILIILIVAFCSYKMGVSNADMSNIQGFYETNAEFNDESGIKSFTFYVGPYCSGSYATYLLMISNEEDKILVNAPSPMILCKTSTSECDCYEFKAKFPELNSDFMPNNMNLKFYPKSGKLILSGPDTVYGCLFKNPVLTEMGLIKDELIKNPPKVKPIEDTP